MAAVESVLFPLHLNRLRGPVCLSRPFPGTPAEDRGVVERPLPLARLWRLVFHPAIVRRADSFVQLLFVECVVQHEVLIPLPDRRCLAQRRHGEAKPAQGGSGRVQRACQALEQCAQSRALSVEHQHATRVHAHTCQPTCKPSAMCASYGLIFCERGHP